MKVLLLLCLWSLNLFAQENDEIHYAKLVEAYYDQESKKPLYIYDSINGTIIDTLTNIEADNSWYKIAILNSEYGWFKIKNIQRAPNSYRNYGYENYWVKTSDFLITVASFDENHNIYLYEEPNIASNKIHKIDSAKSIHILETSDLWAMVSFVVGKKTVHGWLNYKYHCAYPWTTCTKPD